MSTVRRGPLRPLLALLLAALLVFGVAACGSSDDDKGGADTAAAASGDGGSGAPEKITIAYQAIPNGDLVVKNQRWLEEAFPDTQIEWKLFDSGGTVNEAVLANSIDIGLAGSSPVARGLSTPIEYQVPWIHDVIGRAEALVVKDDIGSIEDLKGKKIATPLASTSHYSLLAALDRAGLSERDVDVIDAEPDDIYAAWTRGDIDGAYVWNPNLARIVADGGRVLISSEELAREGKTTYDLAVVTNSFADKYPDAVTTWVRAQDRAVRLIQDDPDAAARSIAAELNIEPADAKAQVADLIFVTAADQAGPEYLGGGVGRNLFATAAFNQRLGQIPSVFDEQRYLDAVTTRFVEAASK
ncbi:ABC transporter substrate-binding protein [Conexibacter sp. JD483]|uniref:taurine ABC transporter substrate-binding protein n=1 Tax=unclassified Conexibacter TaxID=2627773 RepID=UPI0027183BA8|nr:MULTISPECIES: ABC transporter substrate-binding protein [unclassified Conexibacter]MDO8184934.1 ABC transporter substrate-binding protein [Conexibacter sp. CPCC 205706]MDO8198078.1 ABC transporter substrate-binding protein [Conexibacter sp. CPCC 205762]MDR9371367.1 ABC transporter substrate-binding protein [Conexibacter sp. JD483]